MPIFDAVAQEGSIPMEDQSVLYAGDTQYQLNMYMLETALREVGVLPSVDGNDISSRPYDAELRKLIAAVPLE